MGNTLTALPFGIALEEFTHLEEQHDEDSLGKLCLGTRKETNAEGTDGGYRHQEMLVESIAVHDTLCCFHQRLVTYQQVRYEIDE